MSAMNYWGANVSWSPEQKGPCGYFSSHCLFASSLGPSTIWWLACKLNSGQRFKPSLFKTNIWYKLKHWGQANDSKYRALDSLCHSLQPLLPGILPARRGEPLPPDLDSGLSHTYIHWYCQIYDKAVQVVSRVFLREPENQSSLFLIWQHGGNKKGSLSFAIPLLLVMNPVFPNDESCKEQRTIYICN